MLLNEQGVIVEQEWIKSFSVRREIAMDEYVVMPNHFHGIVFITHPTLCRINHSHAIGHGNATLGSLVAGFKSAVTRKIKALSDVPCVWQRNYHEHIIRHSKDLNKIRSYIASNPLTWKEDSLFNS